MQLFTTDGTPYGEEESPMESEFTIPTDANNSDKESLDVEIRLLDGDDQIYEECKSEIPVEPDQTLTLSNFTCSQ